MGLGDIGGISYDKIVGGGESYAHETLSVGTTAVGLSSSVYAVGGKLPDQAFITCGGADVRFWLDGTAPTTTAGHVLKVDQNLTIIGLKKIQNVKFICGTSATLAVSYIRF